MAWVKVYCSLFWLLFSVLTCLQASRLDMGETSAPGPGFYPLTIGVVMGILSLIVFCQAIQSKNPLRRPPQRSVIRWWNIVVITRCVTLYNLVHREDWISDQYLSSDHAVAEGRPTPVVENIDLGRSDHGRCIRIGF